MQNTNTRIRTVAQRIAIGVGGLALGAAVATGAGAYAASGSSSTGPSAAPATSGNPAAPGAPRDESKAQRPDEKLLTGDTAAKVRTAALGKYPGATIQRVETDSDGVYEAHLITSAGARATVEVGRDFAVTGEEAAPGHGPAN